MLQPRVIISLVLVSVVLYSCRPEGCTDYKALNYDADAVKDDGSCIPKIYGCMDSTSYNYNPDANLEDGSCVLKVFGCTDTASINYTPTANTDDGSCIPKIYGCTYPNAINYNPNANTDDGSCQCNSNREMFYGTYDVASICVPVSNPSNADSTNYVMEIYEDSLNQCKVKIFNFNNQNGTQSRFVSGNTILIPTVTMVDDSGGWTDGWVSNYYTTITLSNDTLYIHTSLKVNGDLVRYCDMIGIKQ